MRGEQPIVALLSSFLYNRQEPNARVTKYREYPPEQQQSVLWGAYKNY
ncbi:MAG: hypothetical protein SNH79_06715 [Rikenellaceae bacterium]